MQKEVIIDSQLTNTILMVRPNRFRSNEMTSSNNHFQQSHHHQQQQLVHQQALQQFDRFHQILSDAGVIVIIVQDQGKNDTPDSLFPNNWITFHHENLYNLYPMYAPNRRLERQIDIFSTLIAHNKHPQLSHDYTSYENQNIFLEGTGSIVLDRKCNVAYSALSPRTNIQLFLLFCQQNGYKPCYFNAYQSVGDKREAIYHTNVMMWIGVGICCICLESIDDKKERGEVLKSLQQSQRQIILLSESQISNFAGNCLMLQGKGEGKDRVLAMSKRAFQAYSKEQLQKINHFARVICCDLVTIQRHGGGSARCMIAQIF